ncbi:ComF family protein [Candidatus Peregrinibacteria bacterium]|nr:MAG: ComF family protein [Candidatus Peregrinibacteria bacterium]
MQNLKNKKYPNTFGPPSYEWEHLDGVIYALDYAENPQIKAAIQQFKYKFTQELADYFADGMLEKLDELKMAQNRTIVLIPIPLHKKRLNERGFNQSEVIAKAIQKKRPSIRIEPWLVRTKYTSQQAKLKKIDRHQNLKDAFALNPKNSREQNPNTLYFLVDDVCTTGSTLENAAQILKECSFQKIYGLTVARQFAPKN